MVAVSRYEDPTFRQLRAPGADAEALASVLADPDIGGYQVELLHNATAALVNRSIEALFKQAGFDDQVLLYFSGHGIKDERGELHLAVSDSEADLLGSTAVPARFVRDRVDRSRCRQVLVLLDCCYAGAFPAGSRHRAGERVDVVNDLGGRGCAVMTSSSALEYSFEPGGDPVGGGAPRSTFTAAMVEGLTTGAADLGGDGVIDVEEFYDFTFQRVQAATPNQTPSLKSEVEGRLVVARNPHGVRVGFGLPEEVVQALRSPLPLVRRAVVGTLLELSRGDDDQAAGEARKALASLAEDPDPQVAVAAVPEASGAAEAAALLVSVARRTRALVDRQLGLIDALERQEDDPDQLARLFNLDLVATRLRRDAESLLIIAGVGGGRPYTHAVPLSDVLRAAVAEVEHFTRVWIGDVPPVEVRGRAVNDLVHLVAELVDNATAYSPHDTRVELAAFRAWFGNGVHVTVRDYGAGLSPQAAELFREAGKTRFDVDRMGFAVVARLAARHGIRVTVEDQERGEPGTLATVLVPSELLA
ncbi:signal transduction histidine kinase [Saccharothrix variisporea]|uniref:histidine kinase n=1 Tax=Saccharothrix variisporea TaxID=543527 RepID=A0A495XDH8_9PSEU|nr:signal transduction histidine kinase [Saccharothrix variisporea]